jgi:hypothetical protein
VLTPTAFPTHLPHSSSFPICSGNDPPPVSFVFVVSLFWLYPLQKKKKKKKSGELIKSHIIAKEVLHQKWRVNQVTHYC